MQQSSSVPKEEENLMTETICFLISNFKSSFPQWKHVHLLDMFYSHWNDTIISTPDFKTETSFSFFQKRKNHPMIQTAHSCF